MHTEARTWYTVERRGLEPRSLPCKGSVRPLNHHPKAGPPAPLARREGVEPSRGSFGGSPVTVTPTYSVSLGRSSQCFGSIFFVIVNLFLRDPGAAASGSVGCGGAGGIRTRDHQSANLVTFLFRP